MSILKRLVKDYRANPCLSTVGGQLPAAVAKENDKEDAREWLAARYEEKTARVAASLRTAASADVMVEAKVAQAFMDWDKDHSGFISKEELRNVMTQVMKGTTLDLSTIDSVFAEMDTNHDGRIEYNEFCSWMFAE